MGVFEWLAMFAVVSVAVAVAERIIEAGVIEAVRGRVAICGGAVAAAGGYLMIASDAWQVGLAAASLGIFTMMVPQWRPVAAEKGLVLISAVEMAVVAEDESLLQLRFASRFAN